MDPGEQTTGTRDEQYALISVLYHALHGAENCNAYALDAEATGEARLAGFFREAGVEQARLAERAKGMLGIVEEAASGEVLPGPDEEVPEPAVGDVPPTTGPLPPDTARPSGEGLEPPFSSTLPDPEFVLPEEDVVTPEEAPPDAPQAGMDRITSEDFDPTISALQGGIARLAIGRALAEIETWERKLEATGDRELQAIAGNLGALRGLLTADNIDVAAAGPLLMTLGEQVRGVASGGVEERVAGKLRRLGELLTGEGRSLSG